MNEKKFYNSPVGSNTNTPATWTLASFFPLIQQGTTANNRIGNKIFVKGVWITMLCQGGTTMLNGTASGTAGVNTRFIVYHNKEALGTQIAATTIFDQDSISSLRNNTKSSQVSLKKDFTRTVVVTGVKSTGESVATGPSIQEIFYIPINKRIDYSGNTGTIADILKDDYGYGMCCSAANLNSCAVTFKVLYTDM